MKKILILLTLFIAGFATAQNNTVPEGILRLTATNPITLSTTWQKVDFNGTVGVGQNRNTYGKDPVTGNNTVWWDSTNKLFRIYDQYDKNYQITFFPITTTTGLLTTRATIQYRIVIPNGVSAGVPLYAPYSDVQSQAYVDIGEVTLLLGGVQHSPSSLGLQVGALTRTNGFYIEVRLSNAVLGSAALSANSYINIQSFRNP